MLRPSDAGPGNAARLADLRRSYPVFHYDSFQYDTEGAHLRASFTFTLGKELTFRPTVLFEGAARMATELPVDLLDNLFFHLGLAEMFSYWKATCSPTIAIGAGSLDAGQIAWWTDLLVHGMGEFFFVNQIDFTHPDFVEIVSTSESSKSGLGSQLWKPTQSDSFLVPLGGGRDSAFTIECIRKSGLAFRPLMVNPIPSAYRVAATANSPKPIVVRRTIDPTLLELNQKGFLNGHTPFSAYLAFATSVCLPLYDAGCVLIANERSSNEGNTSFLGHQINHQYSKSARFEDRFDEYFQTHLISGARYISFVRSLYELQIGQAFSQQPQYFGSIRSCNKNHYTDSWCGQCAKCVSVYITTYPFVSHEWAIGMFGRDLFEKATTINILDELTGALPVKPLDCVCTRAEAVAALHLSSKKWMAEHTEPLPIALKHAVEHLIPQSDSDLAAQSLLCSRGNDRLTPVLREILDANLS